MWFICVWNSPDKVLSDQPAAIGPRHNTIPCCLTCLRCPKKLGNVKNGHQLHPQASDWRILLPIVQFPDVWGRVRKRSKTRRPRMLHLSQVPWGSLDLFTRECSMVCLCLCKKRFNFEQDNIAGALVCICQYQSLGIRRGARLWAIIEWTKNDVTSSAPYPRFPNLPDLTTPQPQV